MLDCRQSNTPPGARSPLGSTQPSPILPNPPPPPSLPHPMASSNHDRASSLSLSPTYLLSPSNFRLSLSPNITTKCPTLSASLTIHPLYLNYASPTSPLQLSPSSAAAASQGTRNLNSTSRLYYRKIIRIKQRQIERRFPIAE